MSYEHLLKGSQLRDDPYELIPLREEDLYKIKEWRNAQIDILRQKKFLDDAEQLHYYRQVVLPTFSQDQPKMMLFSFLKEKTCIGYGGLVHIDWEHQRAEVSFLVETKRAHCNKTYAEDFKAFLQLLKQLAFSILPLNRIYTETFDKRPLHISILEKNGFKFEGRMKEHIKFQDTFIDSLLHGALKSNESS